jgi:NADH-quinone oxidoreductase subunit I
MTLSHLIKSFTLWEILKAHALTLKYFFKPKVTSGNLMATGHFA